MKKDNQLDSKEQLFCELFVNGTAPYAGNSLKCYEEVFKDNGLNANHRAKTLLNQEHIQAYIQELQAMSSEESIHMKRYLTQNLMKILDETSSAKYFDRKGNALSPAPLRSVAVSAAKALMDMYKVKEVQVSQLNIEGSGEGNITFNVIVPDSKPLEEDEVC